MNARLVVLGGIVLSTTVYTAQAQVQQGWHGRILGFERINDEIPWKLRYIDLTDPMLSRVLTSGLGLMYTVDGTSGTVYASSVSDFHKKEARTLDIIPLSPERQHRRVDYPNICYACSACDGCRQVQMVVSSDGAYVFTVLQRLQVHRQLPSPGTFATDSDASYYEHVVVTYDVAKGVFLDEPVATMLGSPDSVKLLPHSVPSQFQLLVLSPSQVRTVTRSPASGSQLRDSGDLEFASPPESLAWFRSNEVVPDPTNHRQLLIRSDGNVVEITDRLKALGRLSGINRQRALYGPTMSGNGKLLFVPSGPTRSEPPFWPVGHMDQIDSYDVSTLTLTQTIRLQRPYLRICANHDGTQLYALTPNLRTILILNSKTAWQEREYNFGFSIMDMTMIP